ncbi:MAG: hypothetical protein AAF354_06520 [Pseudomonadota bacterium]
MPTKRSDTSAVVLSPSVQAVKQPPTAPPGPTYGAVWPAKTWFAEVIHLLSASHSMLRKLMAIEWALGPVPSELAVQHARVDAQFRQRSSEKPMLAGLAGQPTPFAGLSQTWGA